MSLLFILFSQRQRTFRTRLVWYSRYEWLVGSEFQDLKVLHPKSDNVSEGISGLHNGNLKDIPLLQESFGTKEIFSETISPKSEFLEVQAL